MEGCGWGVAFIPHLPAIPLFCSPSMPPFIPLFAPRLVPAAFPIIPLLLFMFLPFGHLPPQRVWWCDILTPHLTAQPAVPSSYHHCLTFYYYLICNIPVTVSPVTAGMLITQLALLEYCDQWRAARRRAAPALQHTPCPAHHPYRHHRLPAPTALQHSYHTAHAARGCGGW